jgi:cell division protein FtsA
MAKQIIAVLEIGTSNTVALVGEAAEGGRARVLGCGVARTAGVRKGIINEMKQAQSGVETAIKQAEDAAGVSLGEVLLLAFSGAHITVSAGEGRLPVRAVDGKVTRDDLDELRSLACENRPGEGRVIMDALPQLFRLDDLDGIVNPEGMSGKQLRLGMLFVHGQHDRVEDAVNLLKGLALDTRGFVFSALAAATSALTPEQRNHGVVLIDLGGGTTNYVVFVRNVPIAAGSFGVGGDHVTNDIAQAFGIPINQAEEIKLREGCAVIDPQRSGRRLELPPTVVATAVRSISVRALHTVMEARMRETLGLVRDQIGPELRQVGAGVVFTGGGAYMPRLDELAERVFGMGSRIGEPQAQYIEGLQHERLRPAGLATVAGLLISGVKSQDDDNPMRSVRGWLEKLTGGARR